ncbi:hypothetical protein SETIT_9G184700v2 [Setaria italica]|uniref:Cytochrome P450 n=2 Tax=Setaria italica TaxID=4555 RepID=A0A368SHY7_SETIT|nr:hypothetical protein SETIT_9G184700v2 [Setaria italica]
MGFSYQTNLTSSNHHQSMALAPSQQWKKMRRVLTSEVLSASMEQRFHRRRAEEADHLVRLVYNQCSSPAGNNSVVDGRHVAQHFCGNMIRRLMFRKRHFVEPPPSSFSAGTAAGPGPEEVAHVDALFTLVNYVYSFSISHYIPAWIIGLDIDGHKKVVKGERIHERSTRGDKREPRDFLDVLVSLQDSEGQPFLSLDEIRAQTAEIMFAIVDNPSNAVEWALAEMMNKPEVMQKAIDELNTLVGKGRLVQESDLPRAFRLRPYHAFNPPHVAMQDTIVSGYFIPKDSHVFTLIRFISFSTGRRGCPGVSLGSSVTMMLFARLPQGFTWSMPASVHTM